MNDAKETRSKAQNLGKQVSAQLPCIQSHESTTILCPFYFPTTLKVGQGHQSFTYVILSS